MDSNGKRWTVMDSGRHWWAAIEWTAITSNEQGMTAMEICGQLWTSANGGEQWQTAADNQRRAKWRLSTFDLYPEGGGAWGAGTNMWHPETPASYESLPAPLATQIPTPWIHISGGGGRRVSSDIRSMSSIRPICKCRCPPLRPRQQLIARATRNVKWWTAMDSTGQWWKVEGSGRH